MKRLGALFVAAVTLGVSLLAAFALRTGLTEQAGAASVSLAVAVGGALVALLFAWRLGRRAARGRTVAFLATLALLVVLGAPASWLVWPGRIIHSRFGVTVYGIAPVPALDVVVRPDGLPWFRDKSHRLTRAEVERWLDAEVTDVVIGTGWHGRMNVDPDVMFLPGIRLHVMETPEAHELYNRLRGEGKRVLLVAHSTC